MNAINRLADAFKDAKQEWDEVRSTPDPVTGKSINDTEAEAKAWVMENKNEIIKNSAESFVIYLFVRRFGPKGKVKRFLLFAVLNDLVAYLQDPEKYKNRVNEMRETFSEGREQHKREMANIQATTDEFTARIADIGERMSQKIDADMAAWREDMGLHDGSFAERLRASGWPNNAG